MNANSFHTRRRERVTARCSTVRKRTISIGAPRIAGSDPTRCICQTGATRAADENCQINWCFHRWHAPGDALIVLCADDIRHVGTHELNASTHGRLVMIHGSAERGRDAAVQLPRLQYSGRKKDLAMKVQSSFLRLQIAEDAKTALERQATRHGMTQTQLASRLVGWLVTQPQLVQAAILNNIAPDTDRDRSSALLAGIGAKARSVRPTRTPK